MPTATDDKLAEALTNLRVEMAERFGRVEKDIAEFRGGITSDLRWIKWLGGILLTGVLGTGLYVAHRAGQIETTVATLKEDMKDVKAELKAHGRRLDGIDQKLDTLIQRTQPPQPKAGS